MNKLSLKIMRKGLVIIALLTAGVLSAQSKSDLKKEFEQLEKEMNKVSKNFDLKVQKMTKDMGEDEDMENVKMDDSDLDMEGFGKEFEDLDKNSSTEDLMKMFVEMYQENKKERESKDDDFFEDQDEKQSAKEKEYLKSIKEYEGKIAKIEAKMYKVAKKYLGKK